MIVLSQISGYDQAMDSLPDWAPSGVDLSTASAARMYDYYLGGAHNFAVDREVARKVLLALPDAPLIAQANRAFLHRAVRYLTTAGIRQFIDIGSGIPTVGNVHETAAQQADDVRVLYVDHDPVAVAHSELILGDNPQTAVLQADARHPAAILDSPKLSALIDLSQPVAVLMVALLPFIPDHDEPQSIVARFGAQVASGSYLVISHLTDHQHTGSSSVQSAADEYRSAADAVTPRTQEEIRSFFDGWELVPPGLVWLPQWHPAWPDEVGENPESVSVYAGVSRKA
jgi:hypothetical protein